MHCFLLLIATTTGTSTIAGRPKEAAAQSDGGTTRVSGVAHRFEHSVTHSDCINCWCKSTGNLGPSSGMDPADGGDGCFYSFVRLADALRACEYYSWCGGVVEAGGGVCYPAAEQHRYHLRGKQTINPPTTPSWRYKCSAAERLQARRHERPQHAHSAPAATCRKNDSDLGDANSTWELPVPIHPRLTKGLAATGFRSVVGSGVAAATLTATVASTAHKPSAHALTGSPTRWQVGVAIPTCCRFKQLAEHVPFYLRSPHVSEVVLLTRAGTQPKPSPEPHTLTLRW